MDNTTTNFQCPLTGTLAVYAGWGDNQNDPDPDLAKLRDIQHLFNRMTLGANRMDIEWALSKTPEQVVDRLVDLATEQINGVFTIPGPGLDIHPWADKRVYNDCELIAQCGGGYQRSLAIKREWMQGMIGGNHPLSPVYAPSNGAKTVADQEIDRAKRFKYKMSWFWSNHFAVHEETDGGDVCGLMWYKYTLVHNALGNFKEFTKDIGLCQVMLSYLDAGVNRYTGDPNWIPNENYGRELMELFTMGVADGSPGDYTINDIIEISKVFSGWRSEGWAPPVQEYGQFIFQPNNHDWNTKTVFGVTYTPVPDPSIDLSNHQTAWSQNLGPDPSCTIPGPCYYTYDNWAPLTDHPHCFKGDKNDLEIKDAYAEYEKVHEILFGDFTGPEAYNQADMDVRKHRIAKFICKKIYQQFVYKNVGANGEVIIENLANQFKTNWELAPIVRTLLKSQHFFEAKIRGAHIKSHLGSVLGVLTSMGAEFNSDYFVTNQFFDPNHYDPNDPFGYPKEYEPVVEPATIPSYSHFRWRIGDLGHDFFTPPNVSGYPGHRAWINEYSILKLGNEISEIIKHNFNDSRTSVPLKWRDFLVDVSNNSSDPEVIATAVVKHFVIVDLKPEQIERAVIAFKWTIPSNYFDDGIWSLNYNISWTVNQYKSLMGFIVRQPEFFMS